MDAQDLGSGSRSQGRPADSPNLYRLGAVAGLNPQRIAHPIRKRKTGNKTHRIILQGESAGHRRQGRATGAAYQSFRGKEGQTPDQLAGVQITQFRFSPAGDLQATPPLKLHPFQQQSALLAHSVAVA